MTVRFCTGCKTDKPEVEFRKRSDYPDKLSSWCKGCHAAHRKEVYHKAKASNWLIQRIGYLVQQAKVRSAKKGTPFSISLVDIGRPTKCALTGLPFRPAERPGHAGPFSPSIDRIEGHEGYTPGNVRMVLFAVNSMKGSGTDEEMFDIVEAMLRKNRPEIFKCVKF